MSENSKSLVFKYVLIFIFIIAGIDIVSSAEREVHNFEGKRTNKKNDISHKDNYKDKHSNQCMSCHDGVLAKEINSAPLFCISEDKHDELGASHPVGVDYMEAYLKGGFNHPSLLDKKIRLFDGKVECGSCHEDSSLHKKSLVMSNKNSALCLECHRK